MKLASLVTKSISLCVALSVAAVTNAQSLAQPITAGSPDNFTGNAHISAPFQAPAPGKAGGAP